ncbi:hypothetical protein RQX57_004155 [Vibrio vulnificus]|nr:hypothetical protein [Vibrio vulnificus]
MKKSITLTVETKYSDSDNCVCCEGNHRFMTNLRTSDGNLYDGGELARDVARQLPNGAKVNLTVEAVSTTEAE